MKNFVQEGKALDVVTPSGGMTGGVFYAIGAHQGVAALTTLAGEKNVLHRHGVYSLKKATSQEWANGDPLFFNPGTGEMTNIYTSGLLPAGTAAPNADGSMAASADTVGGVLLGNPLRFVAGAHATVAAADTVPTGLSKVLGVVASYETDPADPNSYVSAQVGDQDGAPAAGSVIIKTWKTTGSDPTPVAADAFGKVVNYLAWGY